MFPRAPVKRFNDQVNDTPAPGAYDVKDLAAKGEPELFLSPTQAWPGLPVLKYQEANVTLYVSARSCVFHVDARIS